MANCSPATTVKPVNQNISEAASTMNVTNTSFIINQPFSIHYAGPVAIQAVLPQFYYFLPMQLNSSENQYLLINTMDQMPPSSKNMQVSSLYGVVDDAMAFQTTNNAYTYRKP